MKGVFTISLDFELHWGGFEKWPLSVASLQLPATGNRQPATGNKQPNYKQYFLTTRQVIPRMLALFEKYQVHVTWAGVGLLMHQNKEALMANFPKAKPTYQHDKLSAYSFIEQEGIGQGEIDDPFHYADSLVKQIVNTPNQELGSHTFSHFYCNEVGQTIEQFSSDLQSAQKAAAAYGIKLKSLVFPRNQFNDAYLRVCYEEGFESVRSNPLDWFWRIESTQSESMWKRLNRGMDAYLPIGKKNTYPIATIKLREGFPLCIPASRLLRPYRPTEFLLNDFKLNRIRAEMKRAAQTGEVYHLWWHPHNFGHYPEPSLKALEDILLSYKKCSIDFEMTSLNMGELTNLIKSNGKKTVA